MQQTAQAKGNFETAGFNVPKTRDNNVERAIANHNWRTVVIGANEAEDLAKDIAKFSKAFQGDCFIFETEDAKKQFSEIAKNTNPAAYHDICYGILGYFEHSEHGKTDPVIKTSDCVVCIGYPQLPILTEIKKEAKQIYTDPIDLDVLITEKTKRKRACQQIIRGPLPV